MSDNQLCGKYHDEYLHRDINRRTANNYHLEGQQSRRNCNVLLMVSSVCSGTSTVSVLWDPGANLSLISSAKAMPLGLKGKDVTLSITKVGNVTETKSSKQYVIPLSDNMGTTWFLTVYGIDEISAEVKEVDVNNIIRLFHKVTSVEQISRPSGKIDLLIGLDWCKLMPNKIEENGNLQLMQNQFGFCVRGSHPSLANECEAYNLQIKVHSLNGAVVECLANSIQYKELDSWMESFMEREQLAINSTYPSCGGCRCGKCVTDGRNCSIQEERETRMIEEGLSYCPERAKWTITYPHTKDPKNLPDNYVAAVARI